MIKMAHAPLPKLIPINSNKICPNDIKNGNLSEVFRSETVKRLLNQPDIVIRAVTFAANSTAPTASLSKIPKEAKTAGCQNAGISKESVLTILPVKKLGDLKTEEVNFLPSKTEGNSDVSLSPIKRQKKECGHEEPCETIICDVAVQQYVDSDGTSPLLAVNIEEHEINAPVTKHCDNENCDTLSIDHSRCRRASIKLYRFDKVNACDICGKVLKTRKSRVRHKFCKRKNEYRHNETDAAQLLKEKMRQIELQLLETARTRGNDYSNPVTGYYRALETLKRNRELLIIPQNPLCQSPIITTTAVTNPQLNLEINHSKSIIGRFLSNIPIIQSQQNTIATERLDTNIDNLKLEKPALQQVGSSSIMTSLQHVGQKSVIRVAGPSQNNEQSITINNWIVQQPQILTGIAPAQPKPFLAPIRIVPITNIISQPSLLHQAQGIPKFCIMADNTLSQVTIAPQPVQQTPVKSVQPVQPIKPKNTDTAAVNVDKIQQNLNVSLKKRTVGRLLKRNHKPKNFKCTYCMKRFSTDWYFKMHVAMHKGEVAFSCKLCNKPFSNRYDMKKHILSEHEGETITCDLCCHVCFSMEDFEAHAKIHHHPAYKCMDCNLRFISLSDLKNHRRKQHKQEVSMDRDDSESMIMDEKEEPIDNDLVENTSSIGEKDSSETKSDREKYA